MRIAGLILAGGESSRMGRDKAFVQLDGRPLLAHVVSRLKPQTERIAISANGERARYLRYDCEVIADDLRFAGGGPLAAVHAGLAYAARNGFDAIATAPVDAPFVPLDLIARLAGPSWDGRPASAECKGREEPLFALWPATAIVSVETALMAGELAVHALLRQLARRSVPFPAAEPYPFLNINAKRDLSAAERWFAPR